METELTLLQNIAVWALPVLLAVTLHEVAHGWMAWRLGDHTAKNLGRLSLNPLKHVDIIGTVVIPVTLLILHSPFLFGWAKPVPVVMQNLRNPRRDMALVAVAGPLSNLLMAIGWGLILKMGVDSGATVLYDNYLYQIGRAGLIVNCALAALNLLPLLPLDGGRIVHSFLPPKWAYWFAYTETYGLLILLVLLITNLLSVVLQPMFSLMLNIAITILGLE
jgi:Zn-dependent protease